MIMKLLKIKIPARACRSQSSARADVNACGKNRISSEPQLGTDRQHVVIYHTFPEAKSVSVAGSFNDWKPTAGSLQDRWCDIWRVDLTLKPGRYEYRFVVDGKWADDTINPNRVQNPFGSYNSVLVVKAPVAKLSSEHLIV